MKGSALARAEALALIVVGLAALAFQLWLPTTHVAEADYQAVAQVLSQERQPGDVVLLAPWWTERARIYVPEGLPVVGYQGSDAADLMDSPRVWVLSEPSLPRAGLGAFDDAFLPQRTALGAPRQFGNLRLQLFQNGRYRPPAFDVEPLLPGAAVFVQRADGSRADCPWNGRAHQCPNGKSIAVSWRDVHFAPLRCLVMEAPGGSDAVVAELQLPPFDGLRLEAGYIWEYGACGEGCTPSTVTLSVNGQQQAMELPLKNEVLHRLEAPAAPQGATVRVALQSQNPNARVVCMSLHGWRSAP